MQEACGPGVPRKADPLHATWQRPPQQQLPLAMPTLAFPALLAPCTLPLCTALLPSLLRSSSCSHAHRSCLPSTRTTTPIPPCLHRSSWRLMSRPSS